MGLIPSESDKEDEARILEAKKNHKPQVGDNLMITIRGRIIAMAKTMTQIELTELHEAGAIPDPIFMWMPSEAITPNDVTSKA